MAATTVGGILQIAGVILVFIQIEAAERVLGAPSWLSKLGDWLKNRTRNLLSRLGIRQKIAGVGLSGSAHARSGGEGRLTVLRNPGSTLEERLSSLQLQLKDVHDELDELTTRFTGDIRSLERKQAEIEARVSAIDTSLRSLIADVTIGARHLQVLGAILIVMGTGLITIGPFVNGWLN